MSFRVRCPRCGRVEEYRPGEEELRAAEEKGLVSVSFFHGDHSLVVFFDRSGLVRRLSVVKAAGGPMMAVATAFPLEELCVLFGVEKVAYLFSAFLSSGRLALVSLSTDLALKTYQTLKEFSGLERPAWLVEGPSGLEELPENAVLIMDRKTLANLANLPEGTALVDIEAAFRPGRKEKRGLRVVLNIIEQALHLGEEGKRLFLRERLGRLRGLVEKAVELLARMGALNEDMLEREVGRLEKEELQWLRYVLSEFRGVEPARLSARGIREFSL